MLIGTYGHWLTHTHAQAHTSHFTRTRTHFKHLHRLIPLKHDSSVDIRILDDAFVKICDLVNDSSVHVRALATSLLGDFTSVSSKFLAQTLDKKLMSHLRVVKSDHERQRELHQGGGASIDWDSGRKWGNSSTAAVSLSKWVG